MRVAPIERTRPASAPALTSASTNRSRLAIALTLGATVVVAGVVGYLLTASPGRRLPSPPTSVSLSPTATSGGFVAGDGAAFADDPAAGQLIIFGGVDTYSVMWVSRNDRWSQAHPSSEPPGRFRAATAYDPASKMVMLFGGRLGPGQLVNDTWSWNGTNWRELDDGSAGPPASEDALMAWDGARAEMVLVAGGETWIWTGNHWVRQMSGDLASAPFAGAMAYDPITRGVVLVGSAPPGAAASSTELWNGSSWRVLPSSENFANADVGGLALDPQLGALLLCTTTSQPTSKPDLWQWTGRDWLPIDVAAPSPLFVEGEVTDPTDYRTITIVGAEMPPTEGAPQPLHVWTLTGSGWLEIDTAA
jgi:hypothetical protein